MTKRDKLAFIKGALTGSASQVLCVPLLATVKAVTYFVFRFQVLLYCMQNDFRYGTDGQGNV